MKFEPFKTSQLWQSLIILQLKRQQTNCTSAHQNLTDENNAAFGSAQADKLSSVSNHTYIPTRWFLFIQLYLMWWFLLNPC